MSYRVIQWATGSIGQISIRHFADNPDFDLVGVLVTSEEKDGRDAGELAGIPALGVKATTQCRRGHRARRRRGQLRAALRRRRRLRADPAVGQERRDASGFRLSEGARAVGPGRAGAARAPTAARRCFGAGIHPGFSGDLLPLVTSRLCTRIDKVTVQEVADLAPHPSHKMNFEGLGFGRDPDEARADHSPLIRTMETIFRESMLLLADGLGVAVDEMTTEFDVAVAKRDLEVRSGHIPKGTVGGMRHEWITWSGGRPVIVFRSFWKMDDDLDPNWGYGTVKYSVIIDGVPSMKLEFEPTSKHPTGDEGYWGRIWTAMNAINAIPAVVAASPGIKTHLDLPLVRPPGLVRPATDLVW